MAGILSLYLQVLAISGLFAIFYDGADYFRVKNILDNNECRQILRDLGLEFYGCVHSITTKSPRTFGCSKSKISFTNFCTSCLLLSKSCFSCIRRLESRGGGPAQHVRLKMFAVFGCCLSQVS